MDAAFFPSRTKLVAARSQQTLQGGPRRVLVFQAMADGYSGNRASMAGFADDARTKCRDTKNMDSLVPAKNFLDAARGLVEKIEAQLPQIETAAAAGKPLFRNP
jgi:hypothetical protein